MAKKKNKKSSKDIIIIVILVLVFAVSVGMLASYKTFLSEREYNELLTMDVMYNNVFVNNIEVAGLTKAQALDMLNSELQQKKFDKKCIYLDIPDSYKTICLTYEEMGMKYDFEPAIEKAYQCGRTGNASQRRSAIDELDDKGEFITAAYTYDKEKIVNLLKGYENQVNGELLDKTKKMNVERTAEMVYSALDIDSYDSHINIPLM